MEGSTTTTTKAAAAADAASGSSATTLPSFVTVSDVVNRLNAELAQLTNATPLENTDGKGCRNSNSSGGFELQTRLPDGSARQATANEISTADFQQRLEQAAGHVQSLASEAEQLSWAHEQRLAGNALVNQPQTNYAAAIDLYLLCLTVAAERKDSLPHLLLFAKVMNNIAVCSLQLQWYRKTVHFCTVAIQHLDDCCNSSSSFAVELTEPQCQLHYKRAKAHRLGGEYECARADLNVATKLLQSTRENKLATNLDDSVNSSTSGPSLAIRKEEQLLNRAVAEAKRNKIQQQRAMQLLLGGQTETHRVTPTASTGSSSSPRAVAPVSVAALYEDDERPRRRTHSTLACASHKKAVSPRQSPELPPPELSYWQMYWQRVGRQAQKLLDWLDERDAQRKKQDYT